MAKVNRGNRIVILGAGLAGLAAAYELVKAGKKVVVIEKNKQVGGLAQTIKVGKFHFDTGPHRWYTKNDMVNTWMLKLLGSEVIKVPRMTRIYFDKKFFHYPIKIKSTLIGMGVWKTFLAVVDYGLEKLTQLIQKKEPVNLEEGYIAKFGRTLYKMFFQRYSEKLWGTSCKNISADWIGQRTRGFNIGTIIRETLFKSKDIVSFVDEFSYPKKGIGRIATKMAEEVEENGGKIILDSEVVGVTHNGSKITSVTYGVDEHKEKIIADQVVSSIPLSDLISKLNPRVPTEVYQVNKKLTYRDEIQAALFLNKNKITPDTWVYVHSLELPFVRFMEMDNWSSLLQPMGTTTLVFEIACNEADVIWRKKDEDIMNLIVDLFIKEFGLITKEDVAGFFVHRVEKEYPVYHIGYRKDLKILKKYLNQFNNLQIVGRNGTFRYNNMDHSIEMGLYAAWNIIEGERKFDIESVNIEREYLEEKHIKGKNIEFAEDQYVEEEKH